MGKKHASQYANFGWLRIEGWSFSLEKSMKRFITSIYNKFFQPINFCVMLFLRFRI